VKKMIEHFGASSSKWKRVIKAFLRERTGVRVAEVTRIERHCIHRMLHHMREIMFKDIPKPFSGTVEIDETFVGGQWRNKPWSVRIKGTKRGHGTSKQAVFGILNRDTRKVIVTLIPNTKSETLMPIIQKHVLPGTKVYTDGWTGYCHVRDFFHHEQVDHFGGEYVRGEIHTNGIESFWGFLKRRLKITGGIRASRFYLYVGEEVWRFNHRKLSLDEQAEKLYQKLVAD
jgi:transposase